MAEFEGKMDLNVETSEIKIEGKFKLTEDELDTVAGGKQQTSDLIQYCSYCNRTITLNSSGKCTSFSPTDSLCNPGRGLPAACGWTPKFSYEGEELDDSK